MQGPDETWESLELRPSLLRSMRAQELQTPLEIQQKAIPLALGGRNLVAIAETGSGKTLAYGLPLMDRVKRYEEERGETDLRGSPLGLVMCPTRELADQVVRVLKDLAHETRLRVRGIYGGVPRARNRRDLEGALEILVSTPGRLERFCGEGMLNLSEVRWLVLDEADHLFEAGFQDELNTVLDRIHEDHRLWLFSATLPRQLERILGERFPDAETVRSRAAHKPVESVRTRQVQVSPKFKFEELIVALPGLRGPKGLIFANTKDRCAELAKRLRGQLENIFELHAGLDAVDRRKQLKAFREAPEGALVCTDVAARGLDIPDVTWIVNYDMPPSAAPYLHRIGRTARIGRRGEVLDFITPRDRALMETLRDRKVRRSQFKLDETEGEVRRRMRGEGGRGSGGGGRKGGRGRRDQGPGGGRKGGGGRGPGGSGGSGGRGQGGGRRGGKARGPR